MRNFKEKILGILLISILIFASFRAPIVYGKTESDELKELLDEYEEDLGDLNQLKKVVDVTYNDLYTATKVDDALKEKLREDISNFENIDGINPLILSVLDIELNSQVNNLDDDNIDDMREEISVIKEWVDAKVGTSEDDGNKDDNKNDGTNNGTNNDSNNNGNKVEQTNAIIDKTTSSENIPYAGVQNVIKIFVLMAGISTVIFMIKYRELKEIK